MSKPGRLQRVTQDFRARLRAHEKQAEQAIEDAYAHVLKTLQPALDRLYDQMIEAMSNGKQIPIHWLAEANRLENIKKLISSEIDHFGALTNMQVGQLQHTVVKLGQQSAMEMLQATVPVGVKWTFGVPDPKAIANIVGATQAGSPLADLFNGFGAEAARNAGNALIRGVTLGDNPRTVARDVQQALGVSRARALTISRTEMLRSYRGAQLSTFQQNSDVVNSWIWSADLGSTRTCPVCIAMNGTEHSLEDEMETHPNCFPAGTVVSGPRVVGSTKRLYTGDLIEIETTFGNFLSVTPNHPILTLDGWIEAGKLVEGGHVFSRVDGKRPFSRVSPNEYQVPSLIEEVVESFTGLGRMTTVSVKTTSKDFHCDGTDGEICIIRSDGKLWDRRDLHSLQPLSHLYFSRGDIRRFLLSCLSTFTQFFKRPFPPSYGIVRRLSLLASLFWSHPGSFDKVCIAHRATLHSSAFNAQCNHVARNVQVVSNRLFRFSCEIALRQFFIRYREFQFALRYAFPPSFRPPFSPLEFYCKVCSFGKISNRDTALSQPFLEVERADMVFFCQCSNSFAPLISVDSSIEPVGERLGNTLPDSSNSSPIGRDNTSEGASIGVEDVRKLIHSLAGSVQRDQIIRIRKRAFHGYVYNLQTELGWYSANNIVTHNCRCTQLPKTKSWGDILSAAGIDASNIPETSIEVQSGADWFDKQDESTQRAILGNAKYNAYADGALQLSDLVHHGHDPDWGGYRQEKSLKDAIGAKNAAQYYGK